jgi:hypothetical protein
MTVLCLAGMSIYVYFVAYVFRHTLNPLADGTSQRIVYPLWTNFIPAIRKQGLTAVHSF